LPHLHEWVSPNSEIRLAKTDADEIVVNGDISRFGYQIVSPPVAVQPKSKVIVRVPVATQEGNVAIGILDESRAKWLIAPVRIDSEIRFDSGSNRFFSVVIANNNQLDESTYSRFVVHSGTFSDSKQPLYTDMLVGR
jgi:hypothetical protein